MVEKKRVKWGIGGGTTAFHGNGIALSELVLATVDDCAHLRILQMTGRIADIELRDDADWVSGASPAIQMIEGIIAELAPTNIPVLLMGESGTGKEMFASRVHRLSPNRDKMLIRISCASATPESLSSELSCVVDPSREASESEFATVLFDEIGDLDAPCQRALLSALPDGAYPARRGTLSARLISTTSRNLDEEVRAGKFRSELYYRLNGVCLRLPPLRDRKEDLPVLIDFFLTKHATQFGRRRPSLSEQTTRMLVEHSWPGNIRELENVIKKVVALGDEQLAIGELRTGAAESRRRNVEGANGSSLKAAARAASREAERELIMKALARTRWNRKRAAQELQISYKSLLYKLKQIGHEETETN